MQRVIRETFRKSVPRATRKRRSRQGAGPARGTAAVDARAAETGFGAGAGDSNHPIARILGGIDAATAANLWQVAVICVTACLALGLVQFVGSQQTFLYVFSPGPRGFDSYWVLRYKAWWVAVIVASYLAMPAIVMAAMPGKRLRDCNLGFEGFRRHFWIYVGLYGAVLPVIWLVSLTPEFYTFYPMYPQAGRSWFDLLSWEALYGIFLSRLSGGRAFAVHRRAGRAGERDAIPDDPFHEAVAGGGGGGRGGIRPRLARVEDEIDLGRRVRPLRGRVNDGLAGARAQRTTAVAALIARCGEIRGEKLEARGGIEPPIKVLQTFALPLGDRADHSGNAFDEIRS